MSAARKPVKEPRDVSEAVFDRWLHEELTRLYDSALSEPLPDDLLRLLDPPPARQQERR